MVHNILAVKKIIVALENGLRIERDWDAISEEEQQIISINVIDRFMKATEYIRADAYCGQIQQEHVLSSCLQNQEENITMDAREAAAYLKIHYETLLKHSRRNQIPYHRIGRKLLFRKDSLDQWILEQEQRK